MMGNKANTPGETPIDTAEWTDSDWKNRLTSAEYQVLRLHGTERPGTGKYNKHYEKGTYYCRGCDAPLYKSDTKFDSGCGWPAFYDAIPGALTVKTDTTMGMVRTEIRCKNCDGHLGHVFKGEGFQTPTDERHCVNSVCLSFKDE
eukprot:Clim_evm35s25 gene=Clim_evmTU35s25